MTALFRCPINKALMIDVEFIAELQTNALNRVRIRSYQKNLCGIKLGSSEPCPI